MDLNTPHMRALMSSALVIAGKDLPTLFGQLPTQMDKENRETVKDTVDDVATAIRRFPTTTENNEDFKTYADHLIDEQLRKIAAHKTGSGGFYPNYLAMTKALKGVVSRKQPTENIGAITRSAAAAAD